MAIVGFTFTNMEARRPDVFNPRVKIRNSINFSGIETATFNMGSSKEKGLKISFEYVSNYGPDPKKGAMVRLAGHVLYAGNNEQAKKAVEQWEKSQSLPKTMAAAVMENILQKCTVQAVVVSRDMSLPAPIKPTRVATSAVPSGKDAKKDTKKKPTKKK